MSLLNGSAAKAREVIDFCMANESSELKAKVFEILSRSGLEPNDPMFMALLLTGQMRVLLEAAPESLNRLLAEWKQSSADSLSEIYSAVSKVKQTQLEQAEAIQENLENISQKCVSDIKEAGMSTVSAIADANSETYIQVQETKKQNEKLVETIKVLQTEICEDRQQNLENMNALIEWVKRTTDELKLTHKHVNSSRSAISQLQNKTLWLKWADWFSPLSALLIVGVACFGAGGWLTFRHYNTPVEKLGRNLVNWNGDRYLKCQSDDNPKCTFWIVPPDSPQREGVE